MKEIIRKIGISLTVSVIILLWVTGFSCAITSEGITILTGDYESPKYISLVNNSEENINLQFSKKVDFEQIEICSINDNKIIPIQYTAKENNLWEIEFLEKLNCTNQYKIEATVKDISGNTLFFSDCFSGFNGNIPKMLINEIRSEYTKPKCEFIELYILSNGNLGGVLLELGSQENQIFYTFPAVEVKAGEYILLHCRNIDELNINELGDDLLLSTSIESKECRDLWVENSKACISKSDVVVLRERQNGKIIDCVLFSTSDNKNWKTDKLANLASECFTQKNWSDGEQVQNAVCSDGLTTTRTLCRINSSSDSKSWIVCATSNATPGIKNSFEPYIKN